MLPSNEVVKALSSGWETFCQPHKDLRTKLGWFLKAKCKAEDLYYISDLGYLGHSWNCTAVCSSINSTY